MMEFICYPKCSTCQKALRFLNTHGFDVAMRDITLETPTAAELALWQAQSGLPLRRFFNTSGLRYKALSLKDRLPEMTETEQLTLLASDGMLIKRPILVYDGGVLLGFREDAWTTALRPENNSI